MGIMKSTLPPGRRVTINRAQEATKEIPDPSRWNTSWLGGKMPLLRFAVADFYLLSAFALPAFSKTHKDTYPNAV